MTNGRAKGKRAELDVAHKMQAWWRQLEPEAVFRRTPMSGGWSSDPAFNVRGDLVTSAKRFPWCVEVKKREAWSLENFLAGKPSPVWGWWNQAQRQANDLGMEPMLLFCANRMPWRMLIRERYFVSLTLCTRLDMEAHTYSGRWPIARGQRPIGFVRAEELFTFHPERFALARPT